MTFKNRVEAGQKLAQSLLEYRHQDGIVYGLPRGGVVVAAEVARILQKPLDILVTKKIGLPSQPEYAVCAITENKHLLCNPTEITDLNEAWLEEEVEAKYLEAKEKGKLYRSDHPVNSVSGKLAFIVDDGIATGLTAAVAVSDILQSKPRMVVVAVPVIPSEVVYNLSVITDEVVALDIPKEGTFLGAVGAYYDNFPQVSDEEVIALLDKASCAPSR